MRSNTSKNNGLQLLRAAAKVTALTPFYGIPARTISEWCAVDIKTAQRWKRGTQRPSPGHLKLFKLYRDRAVLDPAIWPGWTVDKDGITDPDGNLTTTRNQLKAYALVYQLCHELMKNNDEAKQLFSSYMKIAVGG